MQPRRELTEPVQQFIISWVDYVNENPHTRLGEWLYAFGAMAALALKSQELSKEELTEAVRFMNESFARVYDNTETTFNVNILQ